MKKYYVYCTKIYNGCVEVEANDRDEAVELAREEIENGNVSWEFGEETADFAEEA